MLKKNDATTKPFRVVNKCRQKLRSIEKGIKSAVYSFASMVDDSKDMKLRLAFPVKKNLNRFWMPEAEKELVKILLKQLSMLLIGKLENRRPAARTKPRVGRRRFINFRFHPCLYSPCQKFTTPLFY